MPLRHCCCCLSLLWRSVRAMGRFFGCFQVHDYHRRHYPHLSFSVRSRSVSREAALSRNTVPALVQAEEGEDEIVKDRENLVRRSVKQLDIDELELQEEAKFLKACGVLPETPAEIRKFSTKLKDSPGNDDSEQQLNIQSWFPATNVSSKQPQECCPPTPIMLGQHGAPQSTRTDTPSPPTPNIFQERQNSVNPTTECEAAADGVSTVNLEDVTPDMKSLPVASSRTGHHKQKSVRFKAKSKMSGGPGHPNNELKGGDRSSRGCSPYPTPLKLSDDMQTPGTVFTSGKKNKAGARSQYVHGVLKPVENLSYWQVPEQTFDDEVDLGGSHRQNSPPGCEFGGKENYATTATAATVSSWMKPLHYDEEGNCREQIRGKTQDDTPAHWGEEKEEEVPYISPKRWEINGIPNTTTKYKEDQKVHWHATPFEERLEKALSEERRDGFRPL